MTVVAAAQQRQRRIVAGVMEQAHYLADFLAALRPVDFHRASVVRHQDVAELTGHLLVSQTMFLHALDAPSQSRPVSLDTHLRGLRPQRHRADQVAAEIAQHEPGPRLAAQFRDTLDELRLRLSDPLGPAMVSVSGDSLRRLDAIRLLNADWLGRADDLDRSLPDGRARMRWSRQATADAMRTLCDILAERHPGNSIEIRVPPFAAVQCGVGADDPRHTRGTPPNVVEGAPMEFLRLCNGRSEFTQAVAAGRVLASGTRSDLSDWFPLF